MFGRLGVRSRIIAGSVTMVGVVLAILAVVVWRATTTALTATAYTTSVSTLRTLSHDLESQPPRVALPAGGEAIDPRIRQVLDDNGDVVAWSAAPLRSAPMIALDPLPGVGQVHTELVGDLPAADGASVMVAATRVTGPDGRLLTVLVAEPTSIQPAAARKLSIVALAVILAALAVLFLVLRYAVGLAMHPVEVMRSELESINSSREARSVTAPHRDDEIGQLGRAINELLDRLRRSDAERASFVSDAGHELRSPLSTVSVSLELLSGELTPQRRAIVAERASGELTRLSTLVDDLLALAKSDESAELVGATDLDLDDLVLGEAALARARGGQVTVRLEPVRVTGVEAQVTRVVRNLVENAMRHAAGEIRIEVSGDGESALLAVDNDGPVVPESDRERIFERFVRLDEARDRDRGGSGLGLAIVRELVRRHGGNVTATEAPDGWCRFLVTLPVAEGSSVDDSPMVPV